MTAARPILFSGPMVRAILAGTKTQTRRAVKGDIVGVVDGVPYERAWRGVLRDHSIVQTDKADNGNTIVKPGGVRCPYGSPGDTLWVRETWCPRGNGVMPIERVQRPFFRATDGDSDMKKPPLWPWRPSIFMPRWASRLTLRVEAVRVERLQDISEADAIAEGVPRNWADGLPGWTASTAGWLTPAGYANAGRGEDCDEDGTVGGEPAYVFSAAECFGLWWDSINAKRAPWASNPWVWVVTFSRVSL